MATPPQRMGRIGHDVGCRAYTRSLSFMSWSYGVRVQEIVMRVQLMSLGHRTQRGQSQAADVVARVRANAVHASAVRMSCAIMRRGGVTKYRGGHMRGLAVLRPKGRVRRSAHPLQICDELIRHDAAEDNAASLRAEAGQDWMVRRLRKHVHLRSRVARVLLLDAWEGFASRRSSRPVCARSLASPQNGKRPDTPSAAQGPAR